MKKLTVLVMIPALAVLMAAMASADGRHWRHWWGIRGTYAMTGGGNCLWSSSGFTPIPPPESPPKDMTDLMTAYKADPTFSSHFSAQGLWVFRADGTGIAEFTHFGITAPPIPGAPPTFGPSASMKFHFDFKYYFNSDGTMTVEMVPDPNELQGYFTSGPSAGQRYKLDAFTFSGFISADHKTLTLTTKNEPQHYTVYKMDGETFLRHSYGVCNSGRILIRVKEVDD